MSVCGLAPPCLPHYAFHPAQNVARFCDAVIDCKLHKIRSGFDASTSCPSGRRRDRNPFRRWLVSRCRPATSSSGRPARTRASGTRRRGTFTGGAGALRRSALRRRVDAGRRPGHRRRRPERLAAQRDERHLDLRPVRPGPGRRARTWPTCAGTRPARPSPTAGSSRRPATPPTAAGRRSPRSTIRWRTRGRS